MPTEEGKLNVNDWREIMVAKSIAEKALDKTEELSKLFSDGSKPTNGELALMIANLSGMVEQGFKGIHERQDRTNGRIAKAEDRLGKLENWRWYLIGGGSVILFCFGLALKLLK